ncbi:GNAT family N-acetyltransferase [Nocardia xishanensis]|uniref:GNAT family N-acetyltransferase n=1 Tax=Nocardia xishanensis TaxID=238964 RepID=UPI00147162FB|nr:GNAT family N-acetyltransferase [Nocardia xishanensis]
MTVPYQSSDAELLIAKANAFNAELYGHPDQTPVSPDEFDPVRRGTFVVAYLAGSPVACGGYRNHIDDSTGLTAEVKRMYVEPGFRRSGIARGLLAELESQARSDGYRAAILDCGSKQSAAHHLYESCGYNRTTSFSIYKDSPGNRAYLKSLV